MINNKDIEKLSEIFATKEDIENLIEIVATKQDLEIFATKQDLEAFATKEDVVKFKNDILNGQDKILEKLTTLTQEGIVGDSQGKRQKKVLEIHHHALKKNKILTADEVSQVDALQVF